MVLRIIIGYLTNRKLRVRYKQKVSEEQDIYGGGGLGCPLGLWTFLIMIDRAGPMAESKPLGEIITQPFSRRQKMKKIRKII